MLCSEVTLNFHCTLLVKATDKLSHTHRLGQTAPSLDGRIKFTLQGGVDPEAVGHREEGGHYCTNLPSLRNPLAQTVVLKVSCTEKYWENESVAFQGSIV